MLDKKYVRDNIEFVKEKLSQRGTQSELLIDEFIKIDDERKQLLIQYENLKAYQNKKSKEIAQLKKSNLDTSELITEMKTTSDNIKTIELELSNVEKKLDDIMLIIPNIPHESVPIGKDSNDNVEVRRWSPLDLEEERKKRNHEEYIELLEAYKNCIVKYMECLHDEMEKIYIIYNQVHDELLNDYTSIINDQGIQK